MTYQQAYRKGIQRLETCGIADAVTDSWILMEYASGMSRAAFLADGILPMPEEQREVFETMIERRAARIPVQHLTGRQEFMGMEFLVNPHVLIPRQDTEILVEETEKLLFPGADVLDLCTGSGCIAVSLAVRHPKIHVTASDLSEKALETAKENASRLGANIRFLQGDMFQYVEGTFDVIVSNPPYIPTKVIEELEEEVRLHDPFGALDGKEDGLHFYRILASEGGAYLKDGGRILMEIGCEQSEAVEALLLQHGFTEVRTEKDLAGLDRVVTGVYNKQE